MSVIMTLRVPGDPDKLERRSGENPEGMQAISAKAREAGLIAHRFYGSDGQIMVVDEWPDAEAFQAFFESMRHEIEQLLQEVATGEPEITFWRKLDTHDDVGWD